MTKQSQFLFAMLSKSSNLILHLCLQTLFYCVTDQQRVRSCFNGAVRMVEITNLSERLELRLNDNNSALNLRLHVTWGVVDPSGVILDGFVYHLQKSSVGTSQASIAAKNVCNPGNQSYWLNSNDTQCVENFSDCSNASNTNSSITRICPITVNSLNSQCRGTGNFYLENLGFVSIPEAVRSLTFSIDFLTPYSFRILAYYREFVNALSFNLGSELINVDPVQDCPSLLSNQSSLSFDEATQFCCDRDIPHVVARNVTFHELEPDFSDGTVSYTIRWLSPLLTNQLSGFQFRYASADGVVISSFLTDFPVESFPLTNDQLLLLTSCDNTTNYYTTVLTGLTPTQSYELLIRTKYDNDDRFECNRGYCDLSIRFSVPATNSCEIMFGYCDELARCVPINATGFPTLNATCICPEGYSGNGINETINLSATGCTPINYCSKEISPCAEGATCENLPPSQLGATCSCVSGYFGDGYSEGRGCTHVSVVILAVSIPSLIVLIIIITVILRRVYLRRRRREDFAWEAFIANDALREFSMINQLGNGNDDSVWLPTFGEKWEVDRSKLQVGDVVGRGNYGIVYKGLYQCEDECDYWGEISVAVKTVKEGANEDTRIKEFLTEIGFMINIGSHPNVLKVLGCCTTQKPVFLVTDYLKYGDLLHFLWDAREPSSSLADPVYNVTEMSLYKMALQVAEGMNYLTKSRIIHGDLAARNILVGEELLCKISDFGLANDVYRYGVIQGQSERCVPFKWISPERMMAGKVPITSKSDVWSFGNLLYEMITLGCMPHADVKNDELLKRLKEGHRIKQPSTCSDEMYSIMFKCWRWKPSSRPSFTSLVKSLEETQTSADTNNYINLVEVVGDINKTIYNEEINEQKEKSPVVYVEDEKIGIKMDKLSSTPKIV